MRKRAPLTLLLPSAIGLTASVAWAGDPTSADCIAANEASISAGNQHKLRAERAQLLICSASTCPADIRKDCLSRFDEVNAQIPTVVFSAKDAAGADLVTVKVSMDAEVLAQRLEGTALSVDPGEHAFTFEAPGQPPLSKKLVIQEGQKDLHQLVTFGGAAGATPGEGHTPSTTEAGGRLGLWRTVGLVVGGAGVVGLGVGTAFGIVAIGDNSDAKCNANNQCLAGPLGDARHAATAADIGLVAGGVLLAGGAALFLFGPTRGAEQPAQAPAAAAPAAARAAAATPTASIAPAVGLKGAGLVLGGTW
jgi:hypothetical protein